VKRHWLARGLVAALHLGLLAALWLHKPASLPEPSEKRLTTVRLILPKPSRPTPPPPAPAPRAAVLPAEPRLVAPPPIPTETTPEPAAAPAPAPSPLATTPTEPPRSTLRLTLPPGYAASTAATRNPALGDPRSNTPRMTLEDRIADATGGAADWVEERTSDNRSQSVGAQGDHRTVMRRGNTCVEIFRSRITDMDSFNGNVAPRAVSMLGKPYKCK
jgi:hypothetical protein